jgi:hypothetical protein
MRRSNRLRDVVIAGVVIAFPGVYAAAQQPRVASLSPPVDSTTVRWLADALSAALQAPPATRAALVNAVGRAQIRVRDFAGAERAMALMEDAPLSDIAQAAGQSPIFVSFDRADLATRIVCGLRGAERGDDAVAVVRRMPAGAEREWALGHLASITARSPRNAADSALRRRGETPQQWRTALALAREVGLPEARLDALIAVAEALQDAPEGRDIARTAYDEARRVRLADADRQSSRNARLAGLALRVGPFADVRSLFDDLTNAHDRLDVLTRASMAGDATLVRALAPRVVDSGRAIPDPAARQSYLSQTREAVKRANGDNVADQLVPARLLGPSMPSRAELESAAKTSVLPRDAAMRALDSVNYARVRQDAERLPLERTAQRARLWSDLAWSATPIARDTARAYLVLARDALLHSNADSMTFDDVGATIADRQFWIADHEGGIATLNVIHNPDVAEWVPTGWGGSTFDELNADRLRAYADRINDRRLRDATLLRIVSGYLAIRGAADSSLARARALADSIRTPHLAVRARLAVATTWLQRGNAERARTELASLLVNVEQLGPDGEASVVGPLVTAGGVEQAMAWAHMGTAAQRAHRLIIVADAFHADLQ